MKPSDILTVGEVARRSGVPVSTIHFYESKHLITGWRSQGNQRRYWRAVLRRIAIIRVAQRAGIGLSTIRDHLKHIPDDRAPNAEEWSHFSKLWKTMLEHRIQDLVQFRDHLDSCIGCGCLSLEDCPLRNPQDVLATHGAGPRILLGDIQE